jgi:autotransporter-associated beta strand protein
VTKVGTGALTLSGPNTYSGLTTVNNGTLIVNGSIAGNAEVKSGATLKGTGSIAGTLTCEAGAICAPGLSPGTLTIGGLTLLSGSTLQYELGPTRDHIVVTNEGDVMVGGLLDVSLVDGFDPSPGESFSLFEGPIETITGTFSAVNAPIFNGHTLDVIYGANQVTLHVVDAGDFNNDGKVDAADYVVWRKGLGTTYTQDDYDVWRAHFGQTAGPGSAAGANAAVPEPATLVLLMFAPVGWCFRRRRTALQVPTSHQRGTLVIKPVRREKSCIFSGCESRPATVVPAGSNRSGDGGNEIAEAFGEKGSRRRLREQAGRNLSERWTTLRAVPGLEKA